MRELAVLYTDLGLTPIPTSVDDWLSAIYHGDFPLPSSSSSPTSSIEEEDENAEELEALRARPEHIHVEVESTEVPDSDPAFVFFTMHVGARLRQDQKARSEEGTQKKPMSSDWLEKKLAAKWSSLSESELAAWKRAAKISAKNQQLKQKK